MKRSEVIATIEDKLFSSTISHDKELNANRKGRVTQRFWATDSSAMSEVGVVGRCKRRVYYDQKGVSQEFNFTQLARFQIGRLFENWITDRYKEAGILHAENTRLEYKNPVNDRIVVSGEVDLIYNIEGRLYGGEIKAYNGYEFTKTTFHKKTIPGVPLVDNLLQTLIYLYYYTKIDTSLGITSFIITYYDKGSSGMVHHFIELTDDGYPIINGINMKGINNGTNPIFSHPAFNRQKTKDKLSKYEFNINTTFARYADIYEHHESGLLVDRDYDPLYTEQKIMQLHRADQITKNKYDQYKDGDINYLCDHECEYCPFRIKCLQDEGLV